MIQVTVAIADFIMILIHAALWVAAAAALWVGAAAVALGGAYYGIRHILRRRRLRK
jgi:O-antigen/teichoic acid export membrane protein